MVPIRPFLFLALIGAHTGGMSSSTLSYYLGGDGVVQVGEEPAPGILRSLRHRRADVVPQLALAERVHADMSKLESSSAGTAELPEYFAPRFAFAGVNERGGYLMQSVSQDEAPPSLATLIDSVRTLASPASMVPETPGAFLRAQRLTTFDPAVQKLDGTLTEAAARQEQMLWAAITNEMRWTRMARANAALTLAGLPLEPDRALHLRVDNVVFRIRMYVLSG